jgi:hypothetical protein
LHGKTEFHTWDRKERNVYLRDLTHECRQQERAKADRCKEKARLEMFGAAQMKDQDRKAKQERKNPTPAFQRAEFADLLADKYDGRITRRR